MPRTLRAWWSLLLASLTLPEESTLLFDWGAKAVQLELGRNLCICVTRCGSEEQHNKLTTPPAGVITGDSEPHIEEGAWPLVKTPLIRQHCGFH